MNQPRILIAAPKSGSGKTLITCALLGALKQMGRTPVSFKCGPDYIDPMFHRKVQGVASENLDTWFSGEEGTRALLAETMNADNGLAQKCQDLKENANDSGLGKDPTILFQERRAFPDPAKDFGQAVAVMEGVMGLYDGLGGTEEEGSAYHLARVTGTPVILVVDVHGMGRSMIPLIQGMLGYDRARMIRGIILNRASESFYKTMLPLLEKEISVPILGFFPTRKDIHIESRHLGLLLPDEIAGLQEQLQMAAKQLMETVNLENLLEIAEEAELLEENMGCKEQMPVQKALPDEFGSSTKSGINAVPKLTVASGINAVPKSTVASESNIMSTSSAATASSPLRLAVARDEAFCFYYPANLRMFEKRGVELVYFSPLADDKLPEGVDGILMGGGYPELYGKQLSENISMLQSIRDALAGGMPSLAECGGFMYLHHSITDDKGNAWPMCGVIDGDVTWKGKLVRFGYVEVEEKESHFLAAGSQIKGHEFHYYDSTANGSDCKAIKPTTGRSWDCVWEGENHFWGFPHLYYPSAPEFVDHFVEQMIIWEESQRGRLV